MCGPLNLYIVAMRGELSTALTRLVSEVNQETTKNARVHLQVSEALTVIKGDQNSTHPVVDLECLALGQLRTLERLLEPLQALVVEWFRRGDNDLKLATVGSNERLEVGKDPGCGRETAVLGEDGQEVEEDGGRAGGEDAGETGGAL